MKLHLLFVFFLAAPLVGRLLSGDASSATDSCESASKPPPAVVQPAAAEQTEEKAAPAPAPKPPEKNAPAPRKPASPSGPKPHAFTFM